MEAEIVIKEAIETERGSIVSLLKAEKLPADDLPTDLSCFFLALDEGRAIGAIGLEKHGPYGLLRSLVVHPDYRSRQVANRLIQALEQRAGDLGITSLYLLTQTAPGYFSRKGFQVTERDNVPSDLKESSEFSHVCPKSAITMKKALSSQ